MMRIAQTSLVLLGVLTLGITGCSDKGVEHSSVSDASVKDVVKNAAQKSKQSAPTTNKVSLAQAFPRATSNELTHIKACIDALDNGRNGLAMRHARELMDSTDADVKLQAIEVFGWIGRSAVNELAEMMTDAEEDVSSEAQRQWEMAFDEIPSDPGKIQAIEKAAMMLKKQDSLEAVMMKLAEFDDYNAVQVLCDIITSTNASPVAVEVARSEYAILAGEPFVDAGRAEQVIKTLKDRANGLTPEPPKEQTSKTQQGKERHEHVH